ncbi:hypothetical protein DCAR_0522175 [Daucus carota subsp. sativus]|uniref:Uncharacterized protein n=1 Tax=Daucus carota subsp. sativus TaxID=79200 RepID=A0A164ZMN3_DAUCS|nr:PREDICTED: transcription factor bHLH66 isoform X1 [Daucus carota subsp. sativus]WOH02786.1 hypothetical protein DCAR_0522175 [Daucus carota subsp. sativus]
MQSMNSNMNHNQQNQNNSNFQEEPHHSFDQTASHDDFLEQMLNSLPSWPQSSEQNSHKASFPWDSSQGNGLMAASFDDQSVMLASKLRQNQISGGGGGGGGGSSASAALSMLQQQLFMARGLASALQGDDPEGSGLLPLPVSLSNGDDDGDGPFKSVNPGSGDGSVQALFNGFTGSLHASSQTSNQAQHFHQSQGGNMQSQNYGGGVGGMSQAQGNGGGGGTGGAPAQPRQRVRARRGQATDPHSIAERLRRERIAERMKSLQELVPNANKTDKASMLDEIIDYVKFLQLQVKVLSMSRLGGAGAVAPMVADISSEGGGDCVQSTGGGGASRNGNGSQTAAASSSSNNETMKVTEHQVAKLMEEDMGSAMQYLQGKGLCLMPISLATAISTSTTTNTRSHHPLLPSTNGAGGPTSPSLSVLSVQSATRGVNGVNNDNTSVSKP